MSTSNPQRQQTDASVSGLAARPLSWLHMLWRRRWLVAIVATLGCIAAYSWTLKQPRIYQAECTLQYDPTWLRPLGKEVDDSSSSMGVWEQREFFATQNKIISSRSVAEKVVRKLSLDQNADFLNVPPQRRASWKGATVTDAAKLLQGLIAVLPERETRIVHLSVKDRDPRRARLLVNTVAEAYIEKTKEDRLSATTGALEWLGENLDSLKSQLEKSELALHEFAEQHSSLAINLEDQQNVIARNILQLSETLTQTKAQRVTIAARVEELKAANAEDPMEVHATPILDHKPVQELRDGYRELLREREGLVVSYGDKHPKILELDARLAAIKQQIRREIDALIASAEADLREAQQIEKGLQGLVDQANGVGLELNLQEITYRRLERERDNASRLHGALLEQTAQTDLTRALSATFVRMIDDALLPVAPTSPRMSSNLAAGALFGLLLGIGLAFLLEQLDRTVRTSEDAEALGVTVLGVMPSIDEGSVVTSMYGRRKRREAPEMLGDRDLVVHAHPKSSAAECCRTIRTNLTFMSADTPRRTLVVTSPSPREGKTTVSLSLAITLAQSGKRVLIVDTDLRKPRIHRTFNRPSARGVTTVLVGEHSVESAIQQTDIPQLDILAAGPIPPNPSELLHTAQFRELVSKLADLYDQVIFDSPPLAAVTDAAIIAPQVDGAILVIHGRRTSRDALRSALRQLRDVNSHVVGGVLNDVDLSARQDGYGNYYYYYHSQAYQADEPGDPGGSPPPPQRPIAQA